MDTFFHSVHLESDLCKGCINCIKRCPTEAIRVRNGKAHIIKEFCIDCGECIRVCPHHAKKATFDSFDVLDKYKHTVALPAPSLYGQFNNLEDINIILKGLIDIGFDDVYEVSAAAEMISELTRDYIKNHEHKLPVINSACPSVVRLIRVRFPNLIDLLLPLKTPMDLAASLARKRAAENTGLNADEIGIIFISPCPAKVTSVYSPLGSDKSEVDAVIGMSEVYPRLVQVMKRTDESADSEEDNYIMSGKIGITWGESGGEAAGVLSDSYLAADGIENVIRVLEDIEDQKLPNLEFIELNACSGGCVGGVLAVENPYIAKAKIHKLRRYLPVSLNRLEGKVPDKAYWDTDVEYQPVYRLSQDLDESINLMAEVEELLSRLPGLDCGSCGAPSCKALAEDVARGIAKEKDCIYILRDYIHKLSDEISN